jgi:hypothetical protein
MTTKIEGRTQLVGYAMQHKLTDRISEARQMPLEDLRRLVELHRLALNGTNGIDDASLATTAEGEGQ